MTFNRDGLCARAVGESNLPRVDDEDRPPERPGNSNINRRRVEIGLVKNL